MTQHPSFYRATANMLCRMCRDNLGNVSVRYNHHNSTQSFYNAIQAKCFICRNVWQEIVEVSKWPPTIPQDCITSHYADCIYEPS